MSNKTTMYMPWISIVNIFTIIMAICEIVLGLIFILIILNNRAYHSISNCLVMNTVFSMTFYAITILLISVHILQCNNRSNQCIEDKVCFFRTYINNTASTAAIYSLTVHSIHHLLVTIFLHNVRLQIYQFRLILCIIQWLIAFLYPIYFIYLYPQLQYDSISYLCVISQNLSTSLTVYTLLIGVLLPIIITTSIYLKILLFVRQLRRSAVDIGISLSNRHELRIMKRIILLLIILTLGSLPNVIFQCMNTLPDYQYYIYYLIVTITTLFCLIYLFSFTPIVKRELIQWKRNIKKVTSCRRARTVVPHETRH